MKRKYFWSCQECGRDEFTELDEFVKHSLFGHNVMVLWTDPPIVSGWFAPIVGSAIGTIALLLFFWVIFRLPLF
jgi:hypothetical protein